MPAGATADACVVEGTMRNTSAQDTSGTDNCIVGDLSWLRSPVTRWASCCLATALLVVCTHSADANIRVVQPGPTQSKDIWTTSVFSYLSSHSRGPGGGLDNDMLR